MLKGEQTFDFRDNHHAPQAADDAAQPDSPSRSFAGRGNAEQFKADQRPAKRPAPPSTSRPMDGHCLPQQSEAELAAPAKASKRPTNPPAERDEPAVGKRQTLPAVGDTFDIAGHTGGEPERPRACIRINGPWPVKEQQPIPLDPSYKVTPPWHTDA